MNILLTGTPGIGKTTVMERLAELISRPSGFVTSEVRERGRRTGFVIRTLGGKEALLARREKGAGPRVGPYTVFLDGLESIGIESIDAGISGAGVILIDEIGKMEAKSSAFRAAVVRALDSPADVVATLGVSNEPFLVSVGKRPDIRLVEVTRSNRDDMPARIAAMLKGGVE
jgi:nucleoside-triphosphatase